MKPQPFVLSPESYPDALKVLGVDVTVLAANTQTHGYEITLQQGPEGAGPPPHQHGWDESFFVLEGEVEIVCESRSIDCVPGTLVHVPAGTAHGYRFGRGGGKMFELSGGKVTGATRMFTDVARQMPPGEPDIPKLARLLADNGVKLAA